MLEQLNKGDAMSDQQYKTSNNLNTRSNLHTQSSTNPEKWMSWLFRQYVFQENSKILEIGCGNGFLWQSNMDAINPSWNITLSDKSVGMIEESKINLHELKNKIIYIKYDVESDKLYEKYNYLIANHMLYHINDIDNALLHINDLLESKGVLYASTTGRKNLLGLSKLIMDFTGNKNHEILNEKITGRFSLDNGREKLRKYFSKIEIKKHQDSLKITESKPLIDYVYSLNGLVEGLEILSKEEEREFMQYINKIINDNGYINIEKEAGTFICERAL